MCVSVHVFSTFGYAKMNGTLNVYYFARILQGTWVSMGIYSDGSYGIQPGLMYSFPVTCQNEEWSIAQGKQSFHL